MHALCNHLWSVSILDGFHSLTHYIYVLRPTLKCSTCMIVCNDFRFGRVDSINYAFQESSQ